MSPAMAISSSGGWNVSLFFIAAKRFAQFHASEPMIWPHAFTSRSEGRTMYSPFTADEPPRTLPRGQSRTRPAAPGCGTVLYCQS
jgi:hypothetical protein